MTVRTKMKKLKYKAQSLYWLKIRPAFSTARRNTSKATIKLLHPRCRSCFRFEAREDDTGGFWKFHKKPKPGQDCHCWCHDYKIDWNGNQPACEYWYARCWWNLREYRRYYKYRFGRWWYDHVRKHIGVLHKPVPLRWVDYYDGTRDRIVRAGEPQCPRCGEMPYSEKQCQFCGQRFIGAERVLEDKQ